MIPILEIKSLYSQRIYWESYLTTLQVDEICSDPGLVDKLRRDVDHDFDSLCDYDKIDDSFLEYEKRIIDKLFEAVPSKEEDQILELFQNSLRLSWIEHIETKFPVLRTVSS